MIRSQGFQKTTKGGKMRSNKKYTNTTFTKRVDHEEGHTSKKRISEPAVCKECNALYINGRWTFDDSAINDDPFNKIEPNITTCPACKQQKTGIASGFVYISGKFFIKNRDEIENLLRNEEDKISVTNPLARIMDLKYEKNRLTVKTTTEHLAQHFGRVLHKAYDGDVKYDFSHENKLARVYWKRD